VVGYEITWRPAARKHYGALNKPDRERVSDAIDGLGSNPRPHGAITLTGMPGVLRVRVGAYRVLYTIDDGARVIRIIEVRHRREVYDR
jgi:mRNA interferase RelE/StbE